MLTSHDSPASDSASSQREFRDILVDSPSSISSDRLAREMLAALFPTAMRGTGDIDLNQMLRECQFNASTILAAIDPDLSERAPGLDIGRAIAVAKSYVDASGVVLGMFETHGWPVLPLARAERE